MKLLDLFCGAGGAAMGYYRAGFTHIVGIDIKPQPRYPFKFIQADALQPPVDLTRFDFIHASPPCQGYSVMRNLPWLRHKKYPLLIEPTREMLAATGRPYAIENVMGAKLDANWLCGGMFGLPFFRHRFFETNWLWLAPAHPPHIAVIQRGRGLQNRANKIAHGNGAQRVGVNVGHAAGVGVAREAMQIDWMRRDELNQAIPPAYTEWIGKRIIETL
jgi:DNA (cytosine-5)-methyltransferase 1